MEEKPHGIVDELNDEYYELIKHLSKLPHRILQNYHLAALSQMILHELGRKDCFNFKRAVYLVDNPDFDHLIGVAGYCNCECKHHTSDVWTDPCSFGADMEHAQFHNDIKNFIRQSLKRKDINVKDAEDIKKFGKLIGIENPQILSWSMKHGNHGILLYETESELPDWRKDLLDNSVALLSLCGFN